MTFESNSPEQTMEIAENIASKVMKPSVFCLTGGLGAGKTVFAKGFARGLGVTEDVTSPTFAIINEYKGEWPFYHFDVYRIRDAGEMEDTGFEEYFYGGGVCLIEWAELIREMIPDGAVWVRMETSGEKGENYRRITVNEAKK